MGANALRSASRLNDPFAARQQTTKATTGADVLTRFFIDRPIFAAVLSLVLVAVTVRKAVPVASESPEYWCVADVPVKLGKIFGSTSASGLPKFH